MFYGSECWAVDKKIERRMRTLRWMRKDRIRNEYVRGNVEVASTVDEKE